jgi:polyhydroxybutyrate depolymerase
MTDMDSLSEIHHMMVAYPDGTRSILGKVSSDWNSGECCGYAARQHIDDIGFLRAIINDLTARGVVNERRIYIAGFSSGAELAYRAGCELSDKVSAIAVVSGSIAVDRCKPSLPVSLVAVQGTADEEVPFGDDVPDSLDPPATDLAPDVTPSVRYWSALDKCGPEKKAQLAPHVIETDFVGCKDSQIEFFTISGGIHGWPDATPHHGQDSSDDAPMHEFATSEAITRFLLQHRR